MTTRLEWAQAIQKGVGLDPYTDGDIAWINLFVAEGSRAENNPDDTIQPEAGATPYNTFDGSLHVWNYPTLQEGVSAVVATLNNGLNVAVLNALRNKEDAAHVTAAIATASSWDSAGSLYIRTLPSTEADWQTLGAVEVAPASGSAPVVEQEQPPAPEPQPVIETEIPQEPTTTEIGKVEDTIAADAKAVDAAAVAGKVAEVRELHTKLGTALSELEDLTK